MWEDIQKNFILLSKVAKEKKYAQEYLGLLARRGDIGSIRIGKRWYTTWAWFEEFLECAQKKPSFSKVTAVEEEKIVADPAKITVTMKTRRFEMPVRKNISGDIRDIKIQPKIVQVRNFHQKRNIRSLPQIETKFKNVFVGKKSENPLPYKEIKFRKNQDVFSPAFGVGESTEKVRSSFFPKLVLATSFAIMLLLVAASGYFIFSDGIFKNGTVAGASNERNGAFAGINFGGEYFLASAGDKMKESLSVSRVVVQAAKERSANNEQTTGD